MAQQMEDIHEYKDRIIVKENLILKVFTIGYKTMGESIVILILADDIVRFSAVIDCYEVEECNLTLKILNEYSIKDTIDLICMTHPDKDHCKGLNKVLQKANKNTMILYPYHLFDDFCYDEDVKKSVLKISEYGLKNKNNTNVPRLKPCADNLSIPINIKFINSTNQNIYPLEISTYSPVSEIIERPWARNYQERNYSHKNSHNNLSIMLSIALGNFKTLFCGDIENDSINIVQRNLNEIDKLFFSKIIHVLKIPHHGSKESDKIFQLIDGTEISNSITTTYTSKNLPNESIINKYKSKSEKLYCTSDIYEEKNNVYNYGVVETTMDIFKQTLRVENKKYDEIEL